MLYTLFLITLWKVIVTSSLRHIRKSPGGASRLFLTVGARGHNNHVHRRTAPVVYLTKTTYSQPSFIIVRLQHRHHLLSVSDVTTTSASNDVDLDYDKNGGNQGEAW